MKVLGPIMAGLAGPSHLRWLCSKGTDRLSVGGSNLGGEEAVAVFVHSSESLHATTQFEITFNLDRFKSLNDKHARTRSVDGRQARGSSSPRDFVLETVHLWRECVEIKH